MARRILRFLVALALLSSHAHAQTADAPPPTRFEIDVGGGWLSGASAGEADAKLLANERERQPFVLFAADGRFSATPGFHVRAGYALNRRVTIEGGVVVTRPELQVSTRADVEDGPPITVVERIDQYFFEGSILVLFDEARLSPRTAPYATAGAGYLRQLHEGLTVVEHGQLFHAGGGLKHWFLARDQGRLRGAGLRADARVYVLASGVGVDDGPRPRLAISGSLFVAF